MAKDYKKTGSKPVPTTLPLQTLEPIATQKPFKSASSGTQKTVDTPRSADSSQTGWDIKSATDADVEHALDLYFCGRTGDEYASLFMDPDTGNGGLYYKNSERIMMWLGRWDTEEDADDHLTLIDADGNRRRVSVTPTGEMAFRLNGVEDTPMNVDLKKSDSGKDKMRQFLLKKKNGVY